MAPLSSFTVPAILPGMTFWLSATTGTSSKMVRSASRRPARNQIAFSLGRRVFILLVTGIGEVQCCRREFDLNLGEITRRAGLLLALVDDVLMSCKGLRRQVQSSIHSLIRK